LRVRPDGLIEETTYFDEAEFLKQLGLAQRPSVWDLSCGLQGHHGGDPFRLGWFGPPAIGALMATRFPS
jgi:hypothetical protein